MPDDMYSDAPEGAAAAPAPESDEGKESSEEPTAVLPKNFFAPEDLKPGYVCKVKIDKVFDDQVAVTYLGSGDKEESGEGEQPSAAPPMAAPQGGGMGAMME